MRVLAVFSTSFFAKYLRVGEDGPGQGHLCHTDTFLVFFGEITYMYLLSAMNYMYFLFFRFTSQQSVMIWFKPTVVLGDHSVLSLM